MNEQKKSKSKNWIGYIIVFFIGCLVMYAIIYSLPTSVTENITKVEKDVTVTDTGIADAVEKIYDAVVIVSTYKNDTYVASGTGFVYKKDDTHYYILTNHHVIESGNQVTVTFTDGEVIETDIIGSDQYADIAVLSFTSTEDIPVAEIGNSEDSRVGDTVFAVGAPLDSVYSWTVTRGILSGKDRMVEVSLSNTTTSDYVMKVLQTDAAINSGNSGGPLCNSNGEVIGITSLKLVSSGVEGMGFAIPIEAAINNAEKIINGETSEYPYIGIYMVDMTEAYNSLQYYSLIKESGLSKGVIVTGVEKKSPADEGGLKQNDIIISMDDKEVKNLAYLKYYLYQYSVGDTVKITVYRNGKNVDLSIKLGSNKQST